MAQNNFVIIRSVKDGKLYLDRAPSKMSPEGMEIAYYATTKEAKDRHPDAIDVTAKIPTVSETVLEKE